MAEYWKSTPKYWCKHCQIYIRDTAFEKTQHEATGKHQGNLKRFLRDIHRNKEREERDNQRTKNEVERLRNLVSGKPAAAAAGESSRSRPGVAAQSTAPKQATTEERKRQIAQLAEMGVAVPEEYRKEMALVGEWETISERRIAPETSTRDEKESTTRKLNIGVRKRKLESQEENDDEEAQMLAKPAHKGWGKATRDYPGAAGDEDDDLDVLLMRTTTTTTTTTQKAEMQDSDRKSPLLKEEDNPESAVAKTPLKDPDDFDHSKVSKGGEGLDTEEPPSIGNAPVVFKKRKNKSVKQ